MNERCSPGVGPSLDPEDDPPISSQLKWNRANPQAMRAHYAVRMAVRRGHLIPECCEVCGSPHAEAHHDNYDKPLQVRWLCRLHHRHEHMKLKESGGEA